MVKDQVFQDNFFQRLEKCHLPNYVYTRFSCCTSLLLGLGSGFGCAADVVLILQPGLNAARYCISIIRGAQTQTQTQKVVG
jgi:hypothetical protein